MNKGTISQNIRQTQGTGFYQQSAGVNTSFSIHGQSHSNNKMNKTLNAPFRKKQLQNI
jgi:hypothetical protein